MRPQQIGLMLRLLGPLIQLVGIVLFLNGGDPNARLGVVPLRSAGLGLVAAGLVLVIGGLLLSGGRKPRRRSSPELRFDDEDVGAPKL